MISMCSNDHLSSSRTFSKVKLSLVLFVFGSVLVDVLTSTLTSPDEDLFINTVSNRFAQLSGADLLDVWHTDCHRRCSYQISSHVEVACQYDPYRLVHRRGRSSGQRGARNTTTTDKTGTNVSATQPDTRQEPNVAPPTVPDKSPFLTKHTATSFLRPRRASGRPKRDVSIMEECCFSKACSWEEFAEYCQRHPRRASDRDSVCTYS
uniref:Insulin 3 n=1 Tax=Deroceras reticulatum TaxID=145610 RepID=A0A1X9ZND4_DERRE|nr:insulin 3 [Deroceras reticulatum]